MYEFINDCKKIEEVASRIYLELANNRNFSTEVRKVFQKLSHDEMGHAQNLDLVLQSSKLKKNGIPVDIFNKLQDAKNTTDDLFREVIGGNLNEKRALEISVRMEQEFIKFHMQKLLRPFNQKLADLFEKLNIDDKEHVNILMAYIKVRKTKVAAE